MDVRFCKTCGAPLLRRDAYTWECNYCRNTYSDKSVMEESEALLRALLSESKIEQVANLRRNLYDALNAEYTDSEEICRICSAIKAFLPDDFMADFYYVANRENEKRIAEYVNLIDTDKHAEYIDGIIGFLLRSFCSEYHLPLAGLIERTYRGRDLPKLNELNTLLSKEAEKENCGIYETGLTRDVFVAYSGKDMEHVYPLVSALEASGLSCFVAARNLRHGRGAVQNYNSAIREAISSCRSIVFVSTKNSRSFSCDALKLELPFVKQSDISNAPYEYKQDYLSMLQRYKKARVELRISESDTPNAADLAVKEFFDGCEYAYSADEVASRIIDQLSRASAVDTGESSLSLESTRSKLCAACGSENSAGAKFCSECGHRDFVSSRAEYELTKKLRELESRVRSAEPDTPQRDRAKSTEEIFRLAEDCYSGTGGKEKDPQRAVGLYTEAADRGHAEAQNKLGFCYYNGIGTEKDYSRAFTYWRMASDQGLAKAQSNLAICYSKGHGTVMDKAKAFEWWEKAGVSGNANAQCSLGICYYNGVGTKKDDEKAFGWWIRAAEQGHAKSQANVALCYHSGVGVERDDERALEWWQRSAEGGYVEAFFNLGICYQNGEGTNADLKKAKEAYEKVLLSGDPELRERAASAIDKINEALSESGKASGGDGIFEFELLTDGSYCVRIKEEYKAKEEVASRKGGTLSVALSYDCSCPEEVVIPDSHNGKAVSVIGECAFTNCKTMKRVSIPVGITSIGQAAFSFCDALGEIVLPDGLKSIGAEAFIGCDGLEKIYIPGSVYAIGENAFLLCDSLAEITFDGDIDEWEILGLGEHELPDGVSLNFTQMTPSDMYDLGYDYENGRNERKKDPALAFEWYKKSSDAGYAPATYALGWCFKKGIGTEKDLKKAFSFYKLSAEMGYSYAENALGVCYHNGEGVEKDLKEAVKRYKKAADGGIASAQCNLADCYEKGSGTEKDLKKARELYLLARSSKQGSVSARAEEGIRRVDAAIKSSEALEAQKQRAAEEKKRESETLAKHLLYQRTGDNGNADDQYERGSFYMHCDNEHIRNHAEGYLWLEKAANQGHAGAQYECGCYYESNLFSQRDLYSAEKWYNLAASQGHSAAKVSLLRVQAAIKKEEDEKARRMTEFRLDGVCQHCGGRFVGLFSKRCSVCGKPKDYR